MAERGILQSKLSSEPIPDIDFYTCLRRGLEKNVNNPALIDAYDETFQLTFRQLEQKSNLIAQHLMKYGFTRKSTLVLYCENCFEYVLMAVAALRLGGKFAAVNHLLTSKELTGLLDLCDGGFIFTSSELASKVVAASTDISSPVKMIFVKGEYQGCIPFSHLERQLPDLPSLPSLSSLKIKPEKEAACILFSSGTTGFPKATMLSHRNLVASASLLVKPEICVLREKNLVFVPLSHIYGIGMTLFGICAGTCTILMKGFDLNMYLKSIEKNRISIIQVVPPIAVLLAKHPMTEQFDLTCVEIVICGAAPLSKEIEFEVCQKLKGPHVRVLQMYGLTETAGGATGSYVNDHYKPHDLPPPPPGTCGILMCNYEAKVVDVKTGETLNQYQDGELLFRGPQITIGYQKNELATCNAIDKDGWLHTGDIGHYDENGYFFVVDRLKELIKYKGYQVPPAELDALLLTHPDIADCGVIGLPDEMAGELPHAWVVRKAGRNLSAKDVAQFVEENVAPFKRLRGGVKFVEAIPKSPSGKIMRRTMKEQVTKAKI